MALARDRKRILVRGMGNVSIREVETSSAAAFSDLGYIKSSVFQDAAEMEDIKDETGAIINSLRVNRVVSLEPILLQTGQDEIDIVRNAAGKVYAVRHYGRVSDDNRFQYYCMDQAKLYPRVTLDFKAGERPLPVIFKALAQDGLAYTQPQFYFVETNHEIRIADLMLWVEPRVGLNTETAKVLDISGHARHGDLNSDFAAIWQQGTPAEFLRFDGVNDNCSFGDISAVELDATADLMIELWVRPQAADGTNIYILSKKAGTANEDGFYYLRGSGNLDTFKFSDGAASVTVSSAATHLQNVWKHIAIAVDRDGNATMYINGVANGTPQSVAALASGAESNPLYLGRIASTYGQADVGAVRIYNFGASGLPSDIATIVSNHYNAEKAFYGL